MKNLIAFCGPAGVGKTTAAEHLVSLGYQRLSFAAPLRDMLRAIGVSDYYLNEAKEIPCPALMGRTARYALQSLGTEWGRGHIDENIWINSASERIRLALMFGGKVVLDDCRFDNEASAIISLGGEVIKLGRPGCTIRMSHASEAGIRRSLITQEIEAADPAELQAKLNALL